LDAGSFICRHARALNSVRMACPNPKARLCRIEPRPFDQGYDALTEICNRFSPDDCWNVFCEAGYGLNKKRGALISLKLPASISFPKQLSVTKEDFDDVQAVLSELIAFRGAFVRHIAHIPLPCFGLSIPQCYRNSWPC
jgi:hypothetical protein